MDEDIAVISGSGPQPTGGAAATPQGAADGAINEHVLTDAQNDSLVANGDAKVFPRPTFTGSIHVTGSDGSSISYHEVTHETWNANGDLTVQFDKPSLTCG